MKSLLLQAKDEIIQLRRTNEILRAKVDTLELMGLIFKTQPNHGENWASVDVAWLLQKEVDKINTAEDPRVQPNTPTQAAEK